MPGNGGTITLQVLLGLGLGGSDIVPHVATPGMEVDTEERQEAPEGAGEDGDKLEGSAASGKAKTV